MAIPQNTTPHLHHVRGRQWRADGDDDDGGGGCQHGTFPFPGAREQTSCERRASAQRQAQKEPRNLCSCEAHSSVDGFVLALQLMEPQAAETDRHAGKQAGRPNQLRNSTGNVTVAPRTGN
jgi:hypothetical protein